MPTDGTIYACSSDDTPPMVYDKSTLPFWMTKSNKGNGYTSIVYSIIVGIKYRHVMTPIKERWKIMHTIKVSQKTRATMVYSCGMIIAWDRI
jgi:hypothetical protein